jgi:Aspartic acid proteinase inhibitor/Sporulation and spore germination
MNGMDKRVRVLVCALVLTAACCLVFSRSSQARAARQEGPLAGGYSDARVSDPDVASAARFAVREESRKTGRRVTLVAVRRAERQVVAGLNFRLLLSVRAEGPARDVRVVVYRNLQNVYSLSSWEDAGGRAAREVKVYLVALNDAGKSGRKIGCDDSLVAVKRSVPADGEPLKAAVGELLSMPREYEGRLGNYWYGENLKVSGVALRGGTATIRITGRLYVAGVCDEPRIEEQMRATVQQFPGVRRVKVFVGGRPLAEVIR